LNARELCLQLNELTEGTEMEQSQVMDMYNRMVAKCWADAGFKARLLASPAEVLKVEGVELPAGIEFRIVENTPTVQYWVLPLPPKEAGELDDEQLSRVSGGSGVYPPPLDASNDSGLP
jgi:hypothetical protein